jgi:hypothetical protein
MQQFEIVEKENADPMFQHKENPREQMDRNIPSEREVLEQAFDSLLVKFGY